MTYISKPCGLLIAALGMVTAASAQEIKMTYAGYPPPQISSGKAVNFFAEEVEKRTNGRVKIDVHHSGTLYVEEKAIEALLAGTIDLAAAGTSTIGVFTRHYDWVNLPYIVSGDMTVGPVQLQMMLNSEAGLEIQAKVEKELGLKALFMMSSNGGPRAIATRAVRLETPADIAATRQRVSLAPLDMKINQAWGANPIPVPWADTFTGFSYGMFEGVQIPLPHIHSTGFDEIAKYVTMANFQYLPQVMWVRVDFWESLPEDVRKIMLEVGKDTVSYEQRVDQDMHLQFRENITNRGVEIIDLTAAQLAEWQAASEAVYSDPDVSKHTPPELLERLREAGKVGG